MSLRVAASMAITGALVLVFGVAAHAEPAPVAFGALIACLVGGIGACVLEHRGRR